MSRIKTELLVKGMLDLLTKLKIARLSDVFLAVDKLTEQSCEELDDAITKIRSFIEVV